MPGQRYEVKIISRIYEGGVRGGKLSVAAFICEAKLGIVIERRDFTDVRGRVSVELVRCPTAE